MVLKPINQYTVEEVGMWLTAQGLGDHASKFIDAGVDGDVLVSLDVNDLKNDLFLSGLQAKKVISNIEFSKGLTTGGGENGENEKRLQQQVSKLQNEIRYKDDEIAELNRRLAKLECNAAPNNHYQPSTTYATPSPTPSPPAHYQTTQPQPSHHQPPAGARVVGGAARGAAGGAVKGAIGEWCLMFVRHT